MEYRECANCGDDVLTLSGRDWCDGCEEEFFLALGADLGVSRAEEI